MVELRHRTVREQLGAADPAASAPSVAVRVLDITPQFYVPCDLEPNSVRGDTLWLAPDRALQIGGAAPDGFVSDMSDGLVAFEIAGPRADEIVAIGCTLDPSGPILAQGRCAQTVFAGVKLVIYRYDAKAFRLHVERQFAAFLLEWFQQAVTALQ